MSSFDYDLFVIGAGSAGVRASRIAAQLGAKVAVAEDRFYGGTCVNIGCVPKKLFVYASHFAEEFHDAAGFGWTVGERKFDWPTLIANKNAEIERLNGIYERILKNAGVEIIDGRATVVDGHTVEVAGRWITAKHILVATGGKPFVPDIRGREHAAISDDMFYLEKFPETGRRGRRRLYRGGIRRHHEGAGRGSDAALPRAPFPARFRRRSAPVPGPGDAQEGHRCPLQQHRRLHREARR